MLNIKNSISVEYNSMYDILYLKFKDSDYSYGDEEERGIVINYDYNTDDVVGADIWDFKQRMQKKEPIPLPFTVDLKGIYETV